MKKSQDHDRGVPTSPYAPGAPPPVVPDMSGPRKVIEDHAANYQAELVATLGDRQALTRQAELLGLVQTYRRAADILAGRFTVDGEELVDTDLPEILKSNEEKAP